MGYTKIKIYIIMKNQRFTNLVLEITAWGLIAFCVAGIVQLLINIL